MTVNSYKKEENELEKSRFLQPAGEGKVNF